MKQRTRNWVLLVTREHRSSFTNCNSRDSSHAHLAQRTSTSSFIPKGLPCCRHTTLSLTTSFSCSRLVEENSDRSARNVSEKPWKLSERELQVAEGPFINSVTRDGPFFRPKFTPFPPPTVVTHHVGTFTVHFCLRHAKILIKIYPPPPRVGIYERPRTPREQFCVAAFRKTCAALPTEQIAAQGSSTETNGFRDI